MIKEPQTQKDRLINLQIAISNYLNEVTSTGDVTNLEVKLKCWGEYLGKVIKLEPNQTTDKLVKDRDKPYTKNPVFPANPIAFSLMDLVTAKQLGMIRAVCREMDIDCDEECDVVLSCKTDELSKKAASAFIQHLQKMQEEGLK